MQLLKSQHQSFAISIRKGKQRYLFATIPFMSYPNAKTRLEVLNADILLLSKKKCEKLIRTIVYMYIYPFIRNNIFILLQSVIIISITSFVLR